jgi:hypothetical protein
MQEHHPCQQLGVACVLHTSASCAGSCAPQEQIYLVLTTPLADNGPFAWPVRPVPCVRCCMHTLRSRDSSTQPSGGSGSDSCTHPAFFYVQKTNTGTGHVVRIPVTPATAVPCNPDVVSCVGPVLPAWVQLALRFSALKMLPTDTRQVLPSAVCSSVCTENRGALGANLTCTAYSQHRSVRPAAGGQRQHTTRAHLQVQEAACQPQRPVLWNLEEVDGRYGPHNPEHLLVDDVVL